MKLPKFLIRVTGDVHLSGRIMWLSYKPSHHKVKGNEVRDILNKLEPADILLRRYDGYLNTIFTPGFWGHGGIYVGNNQIIHAIGCGVIKEDILDFCRADSVAVLRLKNISSRIIKDVIDKTYYFLETKTGYDYEFKDDNGKVYCTEMVNEVYNGVFDIDYEEVAGNLVLTPDGIRNSDKLKLIVEFKH